jgi:glycosyltransferase involved in cell wall biosynthesis
MKLGVVVPWFGMNIPGGAESMIRNLALHLNKTNGVNVEILTTCVEKFGSDWNKNYYKEGSSIESDLVIRRFKVRKRNLEKFDSVNIKLMNNERISSEEEDIFITEMINSPKLYEYMEENQDKYDLFISIPYMFGTTYYSMRVCPKKSVMIPCFHEEAYAYINRFIETYSNIAGMIFNAKEEYELTKNIYNLENVKCQVIGVGLDTSNMVGNSELFRLKYNIDSPFILYAGRKEVGKRVDLLLRYFEAYKKRNDSDLKLVLIGGGNIEIPKDIWDDVYDLGFVDIEDKYNAYAAADIFCQPSDHESFSIVIMESWLNKTPVIVNRNCEVTKGFARESNAGLYFENYLEFEGIVNYYINNPDKARIMGENGRKFVLNNFEWNIIIDKYLKFFQEIIDENNKN